MRIVLAVVGFAARLLFRPRKRVGTPGGTHDGVVYSIDEKTDKKGRTERWLGMPLRSPVPLRVHPTEPLDRFRRRILLVRPMPRGRTENLYLDCHHPFVVELFESAALQAALLAVFERAHELYYDGSSIWVNVYNRPDADHLDALAALRRASAPLEGDIPTRWRHSYLWKTLLVDSFIWAMVGYTTGGAVELVAIGKESIHVELAAILLLGFLVAVGLFGAVLAIAVLWLRGASRGYGAFLLHAFLLFALLPGGVQLASDLNRGLDDSAPIVREGIATRCEVRRVKGGTVYELTMKQRESPIPDEVKVGKAICDSIGGPTPVTFTLGRGFLGLKWYRRVETATAVWTP